MYVCVYRYVPVRYLRETSEQQKLKLQKQMTGISHYPELDGFRLKNRYKHVVKKIEPSDRLNECKQIVSCRLSIIQA